MKFKINLEGLEAKFNLKDEDLIKKYKENPDNFKEYLSGNIYSAIADFYLPDELSSIVEEMFSEFQLKKSKLLKNYEKRKSN